MLWTLLLSALAFYQSKDGPVTFEPTRYGPQSMQKAVLAHEALHGNDYFGGDMIFRDEQTNMMDTRFRWPGYPGSAEIPYVIDSSLRSISSLIKEAMEQYMEQTCVSFVERTNQKDYIFIKKGAGCSAEVGRQGGRQILNLGTDCEYIGTIVHELGHAIGLFHEHQRQDRDSYLNVYYRNVTSDKTINLEKLHPSLQMMLTPYNYDSIMHYGNYAFSKSFNQLMTLEAKSGIKLLEPYEKEGLTPTDAHMVRKLYKC